MSNKILKGTVLLTGAALLSKVLGMIYAIPFNELVGSKGVNLYFFAYNPYTILLGIATVGIPSAVSKIVSKYNSLGHPDIGQKIFRLAMTAMFITGFISFLILFFSSEWLASHYIYAEGSDAGTLGIELAEVTKVMKVVSFALLIIPAMAVVRGFFQGNERMEPTAVSQVVEQIIRIAFVLLSALLIMKVFKGEVVTAVSYATFGAFVGAIASSIVLYYFWRKLRLTEPVVAKSHIQPLYVSNKELVFEILSYAGPFILVGIAIPLYQQVDSFTFYKAMSIGGHGELAEISMGAINFNGHKLISIPITIATGMSLTIIPALTSSYTTKNFVKLDREINQALQIIFLLVVPAVFGLSILANEAYGSLFGMANIEITGSLLAWYAPVALLFALFSISAAILQGINEQRFALVSLAVGFLIKLSLNAVLIHQFAGKGSILATGLAVTVAVLLNLWWIHRSIQFSYKKVIKRGLFMFIFSGLMVLGIYILKLLFGLFLPYEDSRFAATIMLVVGVAFGGLIYFYLVYKSTLLSYVLGGTDILKRFKRKRS